MDFKQNMRLLFVPYLVLNNLFYNNGDKCAKEEDEYLKTG